MTVSGKHSDPPYVLSAELRPDHLHITLTSEHPKFEMSKPVWRAIADACFRHLCAKILIEADIPQPLSVADIVGIKRKLIKVGIDRCQVAIVDPRRKRHPVNKFAEIVCSKPDIVLRVFSHVDAAKEWLAIH